MACNRNCSRDAGNASFQRNTFPDNDRPARDLAVRGRVQLAVLR